MPITGTEKTGFEVSVCVNYRRLHRRLPPGTSARDAKRIEAELRIAAGRREVIIPGDPPLTAIMGRYMEHARSLRSPDTAIYHAARIGRWLEGQTASQARQVRARIIKDLTPHYATGTINKSLGALKKGLGLAWEEGRTPVDYSSLVKRLPEDNQRSTYLSQGEVRKLADCASEEVRTAIWIALYTGLRRGEILKLVPEDIGRDNLKVQAGNTKTLRYREVPIVPAARPWLRKIPLGLNFEGLKTGFRRARVKCGMQHVTFHDLRRSCGTILLQSGAPMEVVSRILGHSSTKVTEQRYAFFDKGELGRAMRKAFTPILTPTRPKGRVSA